MSAPLTQTEIGNNLKKLLGWEFLENKLTKEFQFIDFKEALAFIVRVGMEAESKNHHPEIFNVYNKVSISLQTHDAGKKVTSKDVDLARAIEGIYSR